MGIKVSREELMNSQQSLQNLSATKPALKDEASRKAAYWISKTLNKIHSASKEASKVLNAAHFELIKELGEPVMVDDGAGGKRHDGQFKLKEGDDAGKADFDKRFGEKLDELVEIECEKLALSKLDGYNLTLTDIGVLQWLIAED